MDNKELRITLTGKNNLSKVFVDVVKDVNKFDTSVEKSAKDITRDFEQIGLDAKEMSQEVSKSATVTKKSLNEVSRATESTKKSFREIANSAKTELAVAGGAFGALGLGVAKSTRDQEVALATLRRTYGDTAKDFIDLANQLQDTTNYSNDAVITAANSFGTLARNYELTNDQIQQLIVSSADLAATKGISLVDAAERVQAAIRGEAESAEYLGLTMNAAAIDIEGVTATMSNAEAAQFRFAAFMDQSSFAMGAAAEQASKTKQALNELQDIGQWAVGASGPIGDVAAALADTGTNGVLAVSGIVATVKALRDMNAEAAGVGKLGKALSLLANPYVVVGAAAAFFTYKAVQGLLEHGTAVDDLVQGYKELAQTIETLPDLGASPAQKAAADAAIAQLEMLIPLYDEWQARLEKEGTVTIMGPHWTEMSISAMEYFDILGEGVLTLDQEKVAQGLVSQALTTQGANLDAVSGRINELVRQHQQWIQTNGQLGISGDELISQLGLLATNAATYGDSATETAAAVVSLADAFQVLDSAISGAISGGIEDQFIDGLEKMAPVLEHVINEIITSTTTGLTTTGLDAGDWWGLTGGPEAALKLQADMEAIGEATGLGGEKARQAMYALAEAYYAGLISADQYAAGVAEAAGNIDSLNEHYLRLGRTIKGEVTPSANELNTILFGQAGTMRVAAKATAEHELVMSKLDVKQDQAGRTMDRTTASAREQTNVVGLHVLEVERDTVALTRAIDMQAVFGQHIEANDAILLAGIQRLKEYREAGAQALEGLGVDSLASKLDFAGYSTPSISLAVDTSNAVTALNDVYGAVVSNTNAIGDQSQGIADWIGEFVISTEDQISTLDDLRSRDKISQSTYNAAVRANGRILRDNALIQEDLARIQAKQAPLIADLTREQAEYLDKLADSSAETQLVALGYMDATESAKAFSAVQLVANAALGGFEGVAEKSIIAAAEADPVLKAMLEDMGLISVGADGTVTVNFDDADGLTQAVEDVASSIDDLTRAILGIPDPVTSHINLLIAGESNGSDHAQGVVQDLIDRINDADDTDAEPTITLNDLASEGLDAIKYLLDNLDGRDVNTTVTTTYQRVGVGFTESRHGGILGYAHGGMVAAQLAEAGPELLRFRDGGQAIVPNPGIYAVEVGTSVLPAPATKSLMSDAARFGGGSGEEHNYWGPVTQTITLDNSSFARRSSALASSRR